MKKFNSVLITIAILLALCAGALPAYASDVSISITANSTVLVVGQETSLTVTVSPANTSYTLASSDTSVATVDSYTKTVYAVSKGTAVITATCTDSNTTASVTIKVRTPTGIVSGDDYYILNCGTGLLLSIDGSSNTSGVNLSGRFRSESVLSQWTPTNVRSDGMGFTRLYHKASTTGLMMYASGTNLILSTAVSARSKFVIHRIESGVNQGRYAMRYNNQYVAMNSSGDVYLTSSSSHNIYWSFMAVNKGDADIFSFNYNVAASSDNDAYVYNSTYNNSRFSHCLTTCGYYVNTQTNASTASAYSRLSIGDIFVYRGHGGPATLSFQTTNNAVTGKLLAHINLSSAAASYPQYYISDYANNGLARQRCVLYLGCSTGVDKERAGKTYNLLSSTFEKGAHFVLGTTQTTYCDDSDAFLEGFLLGLASGNTIKDCIEAALDNAGSQVLRPDLPGGVGEYPIVYVGDTSQYFNN
ncbi:MAG: Ig-like domain-containing protein [Eubacteriales bacterium]